MKIERLKMALLEIPFKASFKHASAERSKTASVWVEAHSHSDGPVGYGEGCPREYVTGENLQSAVDWFDCHRQSIITEISSLESLKIWIDNHSQAIDQNPAAWCAIELALLDLFGKHTDQTIETLLGLPSLVGEFQYSAVLGDGDTPTFESQALRFAHAGFQDFKIKLSGLPKKDLEKIACLNSVGLSNSVRADANNLWQSPQEVINYLEQLGQPFWAIEEPLAPRDFAGLSTIASHLGIKVILDESFTCMQDLNSLSGNSGLWVLNLRISKLGGLVRSIDLLRQASALGFKVIIGAHVGETSILSRAGLVLASIADNARIAMEGAYGTHLLEHDVCEHPVMFGAGGILRPGNWAFPISPGHGLQINNKLASQ